VLHTINDNGATIIIKLILLFKPMSHLRKKE